MSVIWRWGILVGDEKKICEEFIFWKIFWLESIVNKTVSPVKKRQERNFTDNNDQFIDATSFVKCDSSNMIYFGD